MKFLRLVQRWWHRCILRECVGVEEAAVAYPNLGVEAKSGQGSPAGRARVAHKLAAAFDNTQNAGRTRIKASE